MDHSDSGHGGDHGEHGGVHLPDPSIWPLVVGVAAFLLGAALIYWSRDRDSTVAGVLLGAAFVIALISGCGWVYEDGRMKRKAEEGLQTTHRDARYTQVVTFAVPEGQYLAARAEGGVISVLEGTNNGLRDLDGFQDMRVIVSPAEDGPSQVIIETTWADREGLATYEESRTTLLDMLAQQTDQVATGSVQVFDMEVVRDTKDTSFNFGKGAMIGTFSSLLIGGFALGAGLNMFASDHEGGEGGGGEETPTASNVIAAQNTRYVAGTEIEAPPNTDITLVFENREALFHNVQIFAGSSASGSLLNTCKSGCDAGKSPQVFTTLKGGPSSDEFTFTTPGAGEYAFQCAAHPDMLGKIVVRDGAAVPGAEAEPAPAEGTTTPAPE